MELDQLKNIWDKENVSETPEISMEKQKEIHLPLEKIRKNMRMEFWSSLIIIIVFLVYLIFWVEDYKLKLYGIFMLSSAIIITAFYFYKFFLLYKEIGDQKFTTYEMLKDLKTQSDLNQQYYISYYIAFVPIIVASYILLFDNGKYPYLILLIMVVVGLSTLYVLGKWWFNHYYGKYIKQVESLIHSLK